MEASELQESAWTPELGGFFKDLKLEIKANLKPEKHKQQKRWMTPLTNKEKGKIYLAFDPTKFLDVYPEDTLKLVLNWENFVFKKTGEPIPCNEEKKKLYLLNYADKETGIEMEFGVVDKETGEFTEETKKRKARLFEYINEFASNVENFEKNS